MKFNQVIVMDYELEQDNDRSFLKLKGDFTIESVNEARSAIIEALEQSDCVEVSLNDVTEMDPASLQLICSAHRTAIERKKSFKFYGSPPEIFIRISSDAGFSQHSGCTVATENVCLWCKESE